MIPYSLQTTGRGGDNLQLNYYENHIQSPPLVVSDKQSESHLGCFDQNTFHQNLQI